MANTYFQFKQFIIHQDRCSMKVGTDGVLLGAWTKVNDAKNILDVGSGTGLVALMLAQRSPQSKITALEIEKGAYHQAQENIEASPFSDQIDILNKDFNDFTLDATYDLIVSNPPFFDNGTISDNEGRSTARHQVNLTIDILIEKSAQLLSDQGRLVMVLPTSSQSNVLEIAASNELFVTQICKVIPKEAKKSKRILIELSKIKTSLKEESLILEKARHQYTDDAQALFKDFYLDL